MRVQVTGSRPAELGSARGMLLAEIRAAREDIALGRAGVRLAMRRRPAGPPFWSVSGRPLRSLLLVAVAVAVLVVSLVPGSGTPVPGSGTGARSPHPGQRSSGARMLIAAYILGRPPPRPRRRFRDRASTFTYPR